MHRRSLCAVIGLVVASLAFAATPAGAIAAGPGASTACITPTTCLAVTPILNGLVAHRGVATQLEYDIAATNDSDIASATLITHQDAHLVADPASVTIGGEPAPAGSVTTTADGLSIDLAAAMPLAGRTDVDVMFSAIPDNTVDADMTSWAEVRFDDAAHDGPATSKSADVTAYLDRPALFLQSYSMTPVRVPRGLSGSQIPEAGQFVDLLAANNGASVDGATLTLEFPSGFALGAQGVTGDNNPIACTQAATHTWTCPLGARFDSGAFASMEVDVAADSSVAPGTTGRLHASVAPDGITDADPSDDSVDVDLVSAGIADVSMTLTPSQSKLAVGQSVVLTAQVSNDGPDPATDVIGLLRVNGASPGDFRIHDLTTNSDRTPTQPDWTVAKSIAPGTSATHQWRITALHKGVSAAFTVELSASSFDTHVQCTGYGCATIAHSTISVTGSAAAGPGAATGSTGSGSGGSGHSASGQSESGLTATSALASTGPPTLTLVLVAAGLLLIGGTLMLATRRRASR